MRKRSGASQVQRKVSFSGLRKKKMNRKGTGSLRFPRALDPMGH